MLKVRVELAGLDVQMKANCWLLIEQLPTTTSWTGAELALNVIVSSTNNNGGEREREKLARIVRPSVLADDPDND